MVAGGSGELVTVTARLGKTLAPGLDEVAVHLGHLAVADHSRGSRGDPNAGVTVGRSRSVAQRQTLTSGDVGGGGQRRLGLSDSIAAPGGELAVVGSVGVGIRREPLIPVLVLAFIVDTGPKSSRTVLRLSEQ